MDRRQSIPFQDSSEQGFGRRPIPRRISAGGPEELPHLGYGRIGGKPLQIQAPLDLGLGLTKAFSPVTRRAIPLQVGPEKQPTVEFLAYREGRLIHVRKSYRFRDSGFRHWILALESATSYVRLPVRRRERASGATGLGLPWLQGNGAYREPDLLPPNPDLQVVTF